jgi:peptidyl-dipeptidase Dcp
LQRRTFLAAGSAAAMAGAAGFRPAFALAQGAMTNPLLQPWTGPHEGLPPFGKFTIADFKPALEAGMAANLQEIDAIVNDAAPPTFANVIEAQEKAGQPLGRAQTIYYIYASTMNLPDFQPVQTEMDPKLAGFNDKINQNEKLFARIDAVYNSPDKAKLTPEQQRLTWVYWNNAARNGAKLDAAAKQRTTDINQRLATLYAKFSQNLQADEAGFVLYLKAADMTGLPDSIKAGAASAAEEKGRKGEFAITNTRSSVDPFLTYSDRRDLREKVWRTFYSRGDNNDEHDNKGLIPEILQLRAERAKLLGFPTYAHWSLADKMAKTPDHAMDLMMRVWPSCVARVHEEVAEMQAIADKEKAGIKIAGWDYRYYAEKVRKAKYDLDMDEVKPYLQLEKIREGMFWAAGQLYGFKFTKVSDVPVYNPDMVVYEVTGRDGQHVGLWYYDPYARTGKDSGAWMNAYRAQKKFNGAQATIVSNNCNFVKGQAGQPVLISWDDATTMFHEFGHALHGLNSNVTYPTLSGTAVSTDFVEFPSQLNENWLPTPEVLNRFCVHYQTGKPIPADLVAKINKSRTFRTGFDVCEYLASAIIDMKLHLAGDQKIEPHSFEIETLKSIGMPQEMVMRHRTPQFAHIFAGEGYAAGYYSYLWSEVLDHDAYEAFVEEGSPYNPRTAKRYHDTIMSVGNTVDPAVAYRNFRGRDQDVNGYLRAKGFPLKT